MSLESRMQKLQSQFDQRQAEKEEARKGGGGSSIMSLSFGDNKAFILPPMSDVADFNYEVYLHFGFVDVNGNNAVYLCSKAKHGSCPICDHADSLKQTDQKKYDDIKAKKFFIYNVLDENWQHKVLCAKPSQQEAIDAEILATYKMEKVDVSSLANGRQLYLNRTKSQPWCIARTINQPVSFTPEQQQTIIAGLVDLSTYYDDYTPQQLQLVLQGGDPNLERVAKAQQKAAGQTPGENISQGTAPQTAAPLTQSAPNQVVSPASVAPTTSIPNTVPQQPVATTPNMTPAAQPSPVGTAPAQSANITPQGELSADEILKQLNG